MPFVGTRKLYYGKKELGNRFVDTRLESLLVFLISDREDLYRNEAPHANIQLPVMQCAIEWLIDRKRMYSAIKVTSPE